jgi:hypothetical protein
VNPINPFPVNGHKIYRKKKWKRLVDENPKENTLLQIHLKWNGVIACEAGVTEMFGILPHTFLQAL